MGVDLVRGLQRLASHVMRVALATDVVTRHDDGKAISTPPDLLTGNREAGHGEDHTIHDLAGALEQQTKWFVTVAQIALLEEYVALARLWLAQPRDAKPKGDSKRGGRLGRRAQRCRRVGVKPTGAAAAMGLVGTHASHSPPARAESAQGSQAYTAHRRARPAAMRGRRATALSHR